MLKPTPNTALKVAIIESDTKQRVIARRLNIPETRLSHIVRGRVEPTDEERESIAKFLHKSENELFSEVA